MSRPLSLPALPLACLLMLSACVPGLLPTDGDPASDRVSDTGVPDTPEDSDDTGVSGGPGLPDPGDLVRFDDVTIGISEAPCCSGGAQLAAMDALDPVQLPAPTPDAPVFDPTFGVTVHSMPLGMRHTYSQIQAFSGDGRYVMLEDRYGRGDGGVQIYSMPERQPVASVPPELSFARWLPGEARLVGVTGVPVRVLSFDVQTGETRLLRTFEDEISSGPQAWEEVGGAPGARWMGIYVNAPRERVVFYNIDEDRVGFSFDVADRCGPGGAIDWIAPDRTGRYALVAAAGDGSGECRGLRSYDIETGAFVAQVHTHHSHSDKGLLSDGSPFVMGHESAHPADGNHPALATYRVDQDLDAAARMIPWGRFDHVSCTGPAGQGCVVSAGEVFDLDGFRSELYLQRPEAPFDAIRLVHHRNTCLDYNGQTQASISSDGRFVIFASTWGGPCADVRSFFIQLDE